MPIVCPTEGATQLLDKMLSKALSVDENYTLKLYQNNYVPTTASTATSFTECTFVGYSALTLTRAGWNASVVSGTVAEATYGTTCTFTLSSGASQTVYGAFVLGATSGKVLMAEAFATPRVLGVGDSLTYTPSVTFTNA